MLYIESNDDENPPSPGLIGYALLSLAAVLVVVFLMIGVRI